MGKWILESEALEALRNVKDASRLKHRITAVTDRRRLKCHTGACRTIRSCWAAQSTKGECCGI